MGKKKMVQWLLEHLLTVKDKLNLELEGLTNLILKNKAIDVRIKSICINNQMSYINL